MDNSAKIKEDVIRHFDSEVHKRLLKFRLNDEKDEDSRNGLFVYLDKAFEEMLYNIYKDCDPEHHFIDKIVLNHYQRFLMYATNLSNLYGSFTTDPASTKYHGAYPGGLFDHSIAVYEAALTNAPIYGIEVYNVDPIACIFHDICKVGTYVCDKSTDGKPCFKYNKFAPPSIGHGSESLRRLLKAGIKMNDNWELAVNYHMGVFDVSESELMNFSSISEKVPEVLLLHHADMIASKIYHV